MLGTQDALKLHFSYQQVLGLDVTVDDVQAVQVFDSTGQVVQHPTGVSLSVFVCGSNGIKEVSTLRREQQAQQQMNRWSREAALKRA